MMILMFGVPISPSISIDWPCVIRTVVGSESFDRICDLRAKVGDYPSTFRSRFISLSSATMRSVSVVMIARSEYLRRALFCIERYRKRCAVPVDGNLCINAEWGRGLC